ncbi:hypothetical protein KAR91_59930 [Candidatus Pacearchaeota archaeon]|nr:hypothetical protein [Candidatus Pacearchaeota archaeon]
METLSRHFATVTIKDDTVEIELPSENKANEFVQNTLLNKQAGHPFLQFFERVSNKRMVYKKD